MRAVESVILIGALATVAQMSTGCNNEVERIKKTSDMTLMQDNDSNKNQGYTVTPDGVPASSGVPGGVLGAGKTNSLPSLPVKIGDLQDRVQLPTVPDKLDKYNFGGLTQNVQDLAAKDRFAGLTEKFKGKVVTAIDTAQNLGATTPPPSLRDQVMNKALSFKEDVQVALGHTTPKPSGKDRMANLLNSGLNKAMSKLQKAGA